MSDILQRAIEEAALQMNGDELLSYQKELGECEILVKNLESDKAALQAEQDKAMGLIGEQVLQIAQLKRQADQLAGLLRECFLQPNPIIEYRHWEDKSDDEYWKNRVIAALADWRTARQNS